MLERGRALLTIRVTRVEPFEYKEFEKLFYRRPGGSAGGAYFFIMIFLAFSLIWAFQRDPVTAGIFFAAISMYFLYVRWLTFRARRVAWTHANQSMPTEITFLENGVFSETPTGEGFRTWQALEGYIETDRIIALGMPNYRSSAVIPKQALDPSTLSALRDLLQARLKKFI